MAIIKTRTLRITLTIPESSLAVLTAHARFRKCSVPEVIRQQIYALGPAPAEQAYPVSQQTKPQASGSTENRAAGPKIVSDFDFGA